MATFNDLLISAGIDPKAVSMLRHQTRAANGNTPYQLWREDRPAFEKYQSMQQKRPVFRRPQYWAAFVAPAKLQTLFVGLYEVELDVGGTIDWLDPLTGKAVGAGKPSPYDLYRHRLTDILADQIGLLQIDWTSSVRSWAQHASRSPKTIVSPMQPLTPAAYAPRVQTRGKHHDDLLAGLTALGFNQSHQTKKVTKMVRDRIVLYIKRETDRFPLVIHPWNEVAIGNISKIIGLRFEEPLKYYINSNLNAFPIYKSLARPTASRYGIALDIDDPAMLQSLIALLEKNLTIRTPDGELQIDADDRETDRVAQILARIGQGAFRRDLIAIWEGKCALTDISLPEFLRASHIKPWSASTGRERLDPFNGLLLGAHIDALFDQHLISFADDGRLIRSRRTTDELFTTLGIDPDVAVLSKIDPRHRRYLAEHRKHMVR